MIGMVEKYLLIDKFPLRHFRHFFLLTIVFENLFPIINPRAEKQDYYNRQTKSVNQPHEILYAIYDGMHKEKTKLPRFCKNPSKDLKSTTRVPSNLLGFICHRQSIIMLYNFEGVKILIDHFFLLVQLILYYLNKYLITAVTERANYYLGSLYSWAELFKVRLS